MIEIRVRTMITAIARMVSFRMADSPMLHRSNPASACQKTDDWDCQQNHSCVDAKQSSLFSYVIQLAIIIINNNFSDEQTDSSQTMG